MPTSNARDWLDMTDLPTGSEPKTHSVAVFSGDGDQQHVLFVENYEDGMITAKVAEKGLTLLRVDKEGLDATDRRILTTMIDFYGGGPVGLASIAATIGEDRETIEDMYEPYLLQIGFLQRTQRGRMVTAAAYDHLGYTYDK